MLAATHRRTAGCSKHPKLPPRDRNRQDVTAAPEPGDHAPVDRGDLRALQLAYPDGRLPRAWSETAGGSLTLCGKRGMARAALRALDPCPALA